MTNEQLKNIRESWGYTPPEFARLIDTPYTTYRDIEAGKSRVPGLMGLCLSLLKERDSRLTADIIKSVEKRINRDFPAGIASVRLAEDDE